MIQEGWDGVMGMNARNERIAKDNPLTAMRLVDDKHRTKEALAREGAPVVPTLTVIRNRRQLKHFAWRLLPDAWALKPNRSLGGNGIVIVVGRTKDGWRRASGQTITDAQLAEHVRRVLEGEYSPRDHDWALFEPLIRTHPALADVSHRGLPDIRVICEEDRPILAMMRLPTAVSDGRANLHQGAIGAAVELDTGVVTHARWQGKPIYRHPDTNVDLIGVAVPAWATVISAARRCSQATGLRYLGADIVIDHERGPVILEVNARPGLEIQNVNRAGLVGAIEQRLEPLQSEQGSVSTKLAGIVASVALLAGGVVLATPASVPLESEARVHLVAEEPVVVAELQMMIIEHETYRDDGDTSGDGDGDRGDWDDETRDDDASGDGDSGDSDDETSDNDISGDDDTGEGDDETSDNDISDDGDIINDGDGDRGGSEDESSDDDTGDDDAGEDDTNDDETGNDDDDDETRDE